MKNQARIFKTIIAMLLVVGFVTSCAHKPRGPWKMPAKKNANSAAIFGSMTLPGDKYLLLRNINLMKKGKVYGGLGRRALGEKTVIMGDNSFIAPNVEPGTYFIAGFDAGNVYHVIPPKQIKYFKVRPGQMKFYGSYHYIEGKRSMFGPGSFSLRRTKKPSELTLLRWLESISYGTGWEKPISKRIRRLGGKPKPRPKKTGKTK